MGKPRHGNCAFCGQNRKITMDHVPPRSFFPPGHLAYQLITVPACRQCNESFKSDDEYLRAVAVIDLRTGDGLSAAALREKVKRAMKQHKDSGPTSPITLSSEPAIIATNDGLLFTGTHMPDPERMYRSGARIARGLYFHEFKKRVPNEFAVHVRCMSITDGQGLPPGFWENMVAHALSGKRRDFGDVFTYGMRGIDANPTVTGEVSMFLQFYSVLEFMCLIRPKDEFDPKDRY